MRAVVALAPWVSPSDAPARAGSCRYLFVHGTHDRIASLARAVAFARRLSARAPVAFVTVRGGRHALLARLPLVDGLAADFACSVLLGRARSPLIRRIEAGESWITV